MQHPATQRFDALDGLRGLAALAVMVYHFSANDDVRYLPGAWSAVDLFFILSGFVVAHSYTGKVQQGLSWWRFVALRVIRLGPLYLFGTLLGALAIGITLAQGQAGELSAPVYWRGVLLGLLMAPNFDLTAWPAGPIFEGEVLFPLNPPAWSLFFELFINGCFFAFIRLRLKLHWWIAGALMVGLATLEYQLYGVNPGWGRWNFVHGFPRVTAEFAMGMALYQHRALLQRSRPIIATALTACVMAMYLSTHRKDTMLVELTLAPVALLFAASVQLNGWGRAACRWLGDLSYPLYVVHMPVLMMAYAVAQPAGMDPLWRLALVSCVALVTALGLGKLDGAVRRRLMARYRAL